MKRLVPLLVAAIGIPALFAGTAAAAPAYKFRQVVEAKQPTAVTWAPGQPKLMYVAQRTGQIRIVRKGRLLRGNFLNLARQVKTDFIEEGLLGLAFPPDYRKSRRFYVHYVNRAGRVVVAEYRRRARKPRQANPASRRVIITAPQIINGGGHNGGTLRFRGRQLYISIGDGNNPGDAANQAQNLNSLRGKILRVVPRPDPATGRPYRVPPGNPLVGKPGRSEIFAWGLRNPHTFSFHQPAGGPPHMVIADVGQVRYEEINYVPLATALGGNFGWKYFEGNEPYDCGEDQCPNGGPMPPPPAGPDPASLIRPALVYGHDVGCAVISGPVVTDRRLSALRGRVIYGDFCTGRIRTMAPASPATDDKAVRVVMPPGKGKHPALNGFGTNRAGRLFAFSNFGQIYRLDPKPAR